MSNSKKQTILHVSYLLFGSAIIFLISLLFAPSVSANTYPSESEHMAISSVDPPNAWTPPKNANGEFINGGSHNCKFPEIYPPENNDGSGRPHQDAGACDTGLHAPVTRYKLFAQRSTLTDNYPLILVDGCKDTGAYRGIENGHPFNKPGQPDKGGRKIRVQIHESREDGSIGTGRRTVNNFSSGNCVGEDLRIPVPRNAFTDQQKDRYGDRYLTALVVVHKENPVEGQKMFRFVYGGYGTEIYGDDDTNNDGEDFFALASRNEGDRSNYRFRIRIDCRYRGGGLILKVRDIDWGQQNDSIKPAVSLIDDSTGRSIFLGGYEEYKGQPNFNYTIPGDDIRRGATYTLLYTNIADNNGLKFNLPYSQFTTYNVDGPNPDCGGGGDGGEGGGGDGTVNGNCERIIITAPKGRWFKVYIRNHGDPPNYGKLPPGGVTPHGQANDFGGRLPTDGPGTTSSRELRLDSTANTQFAKDKVVTGMLEYAVIIYNGSHDGTGRDNSLSGEYTYGPCNTAVCSVSVQGNLGANKVRAGENFNVNVTLTNTGVNRLNFSLTNRYLSATLYHDGKWGAPYGGISNGTVAPVRISQLYPTDYWIARGDHRIHTFTLTAPNDINNYQIRMYPDYWGKFGIGPICTGTAATYQQFQLDPRVDSVTPNDPEDPTRITMNTSIDQNKNPPYTSVGIPATSTRSLVLKRGGVPISNLIGPANDTRHFSSPDPYTYSDVYDNTSIPRDFQPGDELCVRISINHHRGWIGPGDDMVGVQPAQATNEPNCNRVVDRPFVRMYGSDVFAGGMFGQPGAGTNGDIKTYIKRATNIPEGSAFGAGSGVEFAAFALGVIERTSDQSEGFTSASLRNSAPNAPSGLSFASPGSGFGGNFAGTHMATDYFNSTKRPETVIQNRSAPLNVNTELPDGQQSGYRPPSGSKLQLTGGANYSQHHSLYVEGDVFISNNITYNDGGPDGWDTISVIPSFELFVKGNIYISAGVTRLDGLYVAQPNGASGGKIYTCSTPANGSLYGSGQLFDGCRTQLKVNGAFVAQETRLLRTAFTLSDVPVQSYTPGSPLQYVKETWHNDHAAESFRLTPEMFLARPVQKPIGSQSNGKFDQYLTLPPVL